MGLSIIIPAHNEALYLPKTLQQINVARSAIDQESEVIVVDDASTDQTAEVALEAGAKVVSINRRNIAAVRNAGASQAQYDRFVFLDADTFLPTETLAETISAFEKGWIGGGARVELEDEPRIFFLKKLLAWSLRFFWQSVGGWAAGCYVFCTRSGFEASGGFPEDYFAAEEYFISRSLKRLGKFRILSTPVVTSARKLRDYSMWQLMRFMLSPLTQFSAPLRSRKGLEILYEHERTLTDDLNSNDS